MKLDAVELLLSNTDKTFVTPVFNGSASLRNAAGQMIEEVAKGVRRKKTVDDAFLDKLESDMVSLYRLDQFDSMGSNRQELGPLPTAAVVLLAAMALTWIVIGASSLYGKIKVSKRK